jgi:transposase
MAMLINEIAPVAHLPLVLGMLRQLEGAAVLDAILPPVPRNGLSCGRGVEALVLAILDGPHALSKVGNRGAERGMRPLLQAGLTRLSLSDYRRGQILDALFAVNLNRVFGAVARKALEVYAIPTPWLPQDTTTIALYGAYEDEPEAPEAPQPAYGHSKDGREDLTQVLLSLGVSGDGGLPLRMGLRDGNRSDSTETPGAIEECLALGLDGVRGIVADSKAYSRRTLGLCLERRRGFVTLVPRPCAVRQDLEAWGHQQPALPLLVENPGRTQDEAPRYWHGQSVLRAVEVEWRDGHMTQEALRFVVVHASHLAQQQAQTYTAVQTQEAQEVAEHVQRVAARRLAWVTDAAAAIADYAGYGQGRRGRWPRLWR